MLHTSWCNRSRHNLASKPAIDPVPHTLVARCTSAAVVAAAAAAAAAETPSGIPFSLGLFRAFAMLAETSSDSRRGDLPTVAGVSTPPLPSAGDQPQRSATDPSVQCHGGSALSRPPCEESGNTPRVTLPHLRAILEHGGGMSAADVSDVFEFVSRAKSFMQLERSELQQQQQQPKPVSGGKGNTGVAEGLTIGVEGDACLADSAEATENCKPLTDDKGGRGVAAAVNTHPVAETTQTGGLPLIDAQESKGVVGERETLDAATVRKIGGGGVGEDGTAVERPSHGEPLTVSFATVCDCETVRAWVRKGAFTLPSFDVTSGRRRDEAFAERVVTP